MYVFNIFQGMDVVNNIVGQRTTNDRPNQDVLISSCSGQLVWEIFHEKSWNVNPLKFWNKRSRDWCLLFKWNFALPVKSIFTLRFIAIRKWIDSSCQTLKLLDWFPRKHYVIWILPFLQESDHVLFRSRRRNINGDLISSS